MLLGVHEGTMFSDLPISISSRLRPLVLVTWQVRSVFFFYQYDAADAETLELQAVSILHASRIARMLRRRLVGTVGLDKRRMFISQ